MNQLSKFEAKEAGTMARQQCWSGHLASLVLRAVIMWEGENTCTTALPFIFNYYNYKY